MSSVKRVKWQGTIYDFGNRSINLSALSGTLTQEQLDTLLSSDSNYLTYNNFLFPLTEKTSAKLKYSRLEVTDEVSETESFVVTIASRYYEYVDETIPTETWVNNRIWEEVGQAIADDY